MPLHKSPKKMMRRDLQARMRNKSQLTAVKTQKKKLEKALSANVVTDELFRKTQGMLARAGQKGIIPKGRASRLIGKMMKKLQENNLQAN
jgi:ribosomal protein S20